MEDTLSSVSKNKDLRDFCKLVEIDLNLNVDKLEADFPIAPRFRGMGQLQIAEDIKAGPEDTELYRQLLKEGSSGTTVETFSFLPYTLLPPEKRGTFLANKS